jgi:hypothetical protein
MYVREKGRIEYQSLSSAYRMCAYNAYRDSQGSVSSCRVPSVCIAY